jgi:hypothetical protein
MVQRFQADNDTGAGDVVGDTAAVSDTVTVGVDDTGYDVKFFGATSGVSWLWDESADKMIVTAASQFTGAVTVGVDDTGHDVKFFGATSGKSWMWDESADTMFVDGTSAFSGSVDVGEDGTGYDVKLFGATSSEYMLWDASADALLLTDGAAIKLGNGNDLSILHNGTLSGIVNSTGALLIDNQHATSDIQIDMGSDSSATEVQFRNDSGTVVMSMDGAQTILIGSGSTLCQKYAIANTITLAAGEAVYMTAAARLDKADASALATSTFLGIVIVGGTGDAGGTVFATIATVDGIEIDGLTITGTEDEGDMVYLSTTAGGLSTTAPTSAGEVVLPLGICTAAAGALQLRVGEAIEL